MELVAANLSEGNASGPEPPAAEPPPLAGLGVENFVTLAVFGLIFALGVLGNGLVIAVLARSRPGRRRSTTNLFILNLSVADLAYLLFCVPFQATVYALPTWVLGAFICKFIHYFFTVSMLVSIFTLAAMSVDRYVAIVHSRRASALRVSRNALLGVGCIWALSVAMASPVAYHQRLFHRDAGNQTFCWEQWPDQRHKKAYVLCTFVFGYLLPLLLICFCYAKVGAGARGGPWVPGTSACPRARSEPRGSPRSFAPVLLRAGPHGGRCPARCAPASTGLAGLMLLGKSPAVWGTPGKFSVHCLVAAFPPGRSQRASHLPPAPRLSRRWAPTQRPLLSPGIPLPPPRLSDSNARACSGVAGAQGAPASAAPASTQGRGCASGPPPRGPRGGAAGTWLPRAWLCEATAHGHTPSRFILRISSALTPHGAQF